MQFYRERKEDHASNARYISYILRYGFVETVILGIDKQQQAATATEAATPTTNRVICLLMVGSASGGSHELAGTYPSVSQVGEEWSPIHVTTTIMLDFASGNSATPATEIKRKRARDNIIYTVKAELRRERPSRSLLRCDAGHFARWVSRSIERMVRKRRASCWACRFLHVYTL